MHSIWKDSLKRIQTNKGKAKQGKNAKHDTNQVQRHQRKEANGESKRNTSEGNKGKQEKKLEDGTDEKIKASEKQ